MFSNSSFIETFGLGKGGVVCIVGAGGKTSLMFHLAGESSKQGLRTCVSTTTKMFIPSEDQYDTCNLSARGYADTPPKKPGIYVAGIPVSAIKMQGLSEELLAQNSQLFDITLLEADGAANKPLKGWLQSEPVIPPATTHTIGVVDIETVGQVVSNDLIHRLDCFCAITGAEKGEMVTIHHLHNMIVHDMGLFLHAKGKRIVFINKVESQKSASNTAELMNLLKDFVVYAGSIKEKKIVAKKSSDRGLQ